MPDHAALRDKLIRSRGFFRAADTVLTDALAILDTMESAPEVPAPEPVEEPVPAVVEPPDIPPPPVEEEPAPEPTPEPVPLPPPPVDVIDSQVVFPSEAVALIAGPQLVMGASPWPWFDTNAAEAWHRHMGEILPRWPTDKSSDFRWMANYYDGMGLGGYILYYRTGDESMLPKVRTFVDAWAEWLKYSKAQGWGYGSPRNVSLGGVILRAQDGKPALWSLAAAVTREHYPTWIGRAVSQDLQALHMGVRDGAYTLQHVVWLAGTHPDAKVRSEMRGYADEAVHEYFLPKQRADGGWYWTDSNYQAPKGEFMQPFMVGLLLDALTDYHRLTGDSATAAAIPRAVDWMWNYYRKDLTVTATTGGANEIGRTHQWRNFPYFGYADGRMSDATSLAGGWDWNTLREARQANCTIVSAFGYAFKLTGEERFLERGDEIFASTFGKAGGPLSDGMSSLADYKPKEYGQCYRSAGHYLAWRLGG